jgi:hypothetical protein
MINKEIKKKKNQITQTQCELNFFSNF